MSIEVGDYITPRYDVQVHSGLIIDEGTPCRVISVLNSRYVTAVDIYNMVWTLRCNEFRKLSPLEAIARAL